MKKTVILILAVLPIVLLITIAFAGRIFSMYRHVSVEKVSFTNDSAEELEDNYTLKINVGQSVSTSIKILPELASNKSVSYTSSDESVCTIDEHGTVRGVSIGTATLWVKTFDSGKTDSLEVIVTEENVTGVNLSQSELSLSIGQSHTLNAEVVPYTAINKRVLFSSSNPSVASVNTAGKITAVSAGEAIITVTTEEGGFTAECTVTVTESEPLIRFNFDGVDGIIKSGVGYITTLDSINLLLYMQLHPSINAQDISIILVNDDCSTLEDGVLSFTSSGIARIVVCIGPVESSETRFEFAFLHQ